MMERSTRNQMIAGRQSSEVSDDLRLTLSKSYMDEFLGGRFGKWFITGELRADYLAKFTFGAADQYRSS
jgi:hypothetical protein